MRMVCGMGVDVNHSMYVPILDLDRTSRVAVGGNSPPVENNFSRRESDVCRDVLCVVPAPPSNISNKATVVYAGEEHVNAGLSDPNARLFVYLQIDVLIFSHRA